MNAELVRGLIRMGFFVGVHMEHGHDMATLDEVVDALAAPIVQAMGDDEVLPPSSGLAGCHMCVVNTPKQCVRPLSHGGWHISNSGTTWPS